MRLELPAAVSALALLTAAAVAQVQPGQPGDISPEQQKLIQKFQDVRMQVIQNMQKQGIDPMQYFQDIGRKMQDGTFDVNEMNQDLIDKGLIDQATITDIQTTAQKLTLDSLKKQLGMTDEEFAAILPQIQAVLSAQGPAGARGPSLGGFGGMGGFASASNPDPELIKARRALHDAVKDPATPNDVLAEKLKTYHDAKAAAVAALKTTQKSLAELLTVKQEAVMVKVGILD